MMVLTHPRRAHHRRHGLTLTLTLTLTRRAHHRRHGAGRCAVLLRPARAAAAEQRLRQDAARRHL
eukprot:scaffold80383_cov27-Phaeocystis_antarctica.AAC.1